MALVVRDFKYKVQYTGESVEKVVYTHFNESMVTKNGMKSTMLSLRVKIYLQNFRSKIYLLAYAQVKSVLLLWLRQKEKWKCIVYGNGVWRDSKPVYLWKSNMEIV